MSITLDENQVAALAELDAGMAAIGEGFDRFVKGADACEAAGVPPQIIQAKAMELQGLVMGKMMGGGGAPA